jgi:hypothetical protein
MTTVHGDQRSLAGADRLHGYYLQNLIGQPLESTIAMGRLIFGGVLERHPELRFGWVHGGGFTPYQIGRWGRRHDGRGAGAGARAHRHGLPAHPAKLIWEAKQPDEATQA